MGRPSQNKTRINITLNNDIVNRLRNSRDGRDSRYKQYKISEYIEKLIKIDFQYNILINCSKLIRTKEKYNRLKKKYEKNLKTRVIENKNIQKARIGVNKERRKDNIKNISTDDVYKFLDKLN